MKHVNVSSQQFDIHKISARDVLDTATRSPFVTLDVFELEEPSFPAVCFILFIGLLKQISHWSFYKCGNFYILLLSRVRESPQWVQY